MADHDEAVNFWTDEMIDRLGTSADLSNKRGHPTGLVSYADKHPTKMRRFVTRCPRCDKPINVHWVPVDELFHFDCTRKVPEPCAYSTTLSSDSYRELLGQMTDGNDKPIPGNLLCSRCDRVGLDGPQRR